MSEHSLTAPKTRFPWRLAVKLVLETAGYTAAVCVMFGGTALLIEKGYDLFGLTGLMLSFAALGLCVAVSENATDIWEVVIPIADRKWAAFRDRLDV